MSIEQLKMRLRDIPGIENLSMTLIGGRRSFGFNGLIAAVDPNASDDQIEHAIRNTAMLRTNVTPIPTVNLTEPKTMTTPASGSFAASLKAMMDTARAGIEQARTDGQAKVKEAISKLDDAKIATTKVAGNIAETIENEAASVMSELGQISNDL